MNSNEINFLFQIAIHFARNGQKVWYVTAKELEELPLVKNDAGQQSIINRDVLRNIYFKYLSSRPLIEDIMQLEFYRSKPNIVIIDFLHTFFDSPDSATFDAMEFMRRHMLITGSIHSSMRTLVRCLNTNCYSIVCLNRTFNQIYDEFIQIYVDSYFGKENIFTSSKDLLNAFILNPSF